MSDDNNNSKHTERDSYYAKQRREFRDRKAGAAGNSGGNKQFHRPKAHQPGMPQLPDTVRLYGIHTVKAAMENPARKIINMMVSKNALARLEVGGIETLPFDAEIVHPAEIDKVLGTDAIHQGVMIETKPLPVGQLSDLKDRPLILVLDQVTDPHNVGAILRSAVAFEAGAVITTMRHSPFESGVMAKSASGALELIPYIQIGNLAKTIDELHELGFTTVGLDSESEDNLEDALTGDKIALVLGAEGKGLRQKTRDTVHQLARLEMPGAIKSLNVSNASAISLYAAHSYLKK